MKKHLVLFFLVIIGVGLAAKWDASARVLPGPGQKFAIESGIFGIYEFTEKPKMGMGILRIEVFNARNEKIAPFLIKASYGMPSMPGAHDSGELVFKLNKKLNYLLPISIAMPGDWEVQVAFYRGDRLVLSGTIRFDV